jgi:hypothetical protein
VITDVNHPWERRTNLLSLSTLVRFLYRRGHHHHDAHTTRKAQFFALEPTDASQKRWNDNATGVTHHPMSVKMTTNH